MPSLTRRSLLLSAPLFLAGCATSRIGSVNTKAPRRIDDYYLAMYAPVTDDQFPIPAPDLTKIEPQFYRQEVPVEGGQSPGTVVVDTQARFLYYVLGGGRALRYGIGVGKAGLEFEGTGVGLAMAQRIMERHGGKIRMTGEVNNGATVFLYFPQE